MGSWERLQEAKTEAQEKDRTRRENIAKYYLDLSKLTFAALVLGSVICWRNGRRHCDNSDIGHDRESNI